MGRKLLITGAILNFIITAGRIATLFFLDLVLESSGIAGTMEKYADIAPSWTRYITAAIVTILFALMGFYGLSGARVLRKFPLLKPGIALITIAYLVRGVFGLAYEILSEEQWINGIVFSSIALFIGFCYFSGGIWRWHGKGRERYYPKKK